MNTSLPTHPLSALGFEPIASAPRTAPRSLADLGFEPVGLRVSRQARQAARQIAREPRLQGTMQQMTVRGQALGRRDDDSGRIVVQPTDNPAINQALATDAMSHYQARLTAILRKVRGARLAATRDAKKPRRLAEKIVAQGQPPQTVADYGAAQVAVDSPQAKDAVVAAIRARFTILREQDHFTDGDPQYGYRSYTLQLQMPNGASEELQIVPREVFDVNRIEHHQYKRARNRELAGDCADHLKTEARALNDAAMAQFNSRNRTGIETPGGRAKEWVSKGVRVRLADGTMARVVYADPNMRIARVRTDDGRNVTVRRKDLTLIR